MASKNEKVAYKTKCDVPSATDFLWIDENDKDVLEYIKKLCELKTLAENSELMKPIDEKKKRTNQPVLVKATTIASPRVNSKDLGSALSLKRESNAKENETGINNLFPNDTLITLPQQKKSSPANKNNYYHSINSLKESTLQRTTDPKEEESKKEKESKEQETFSLHNRIKELQDYTQHLVFDNARLCGEKTSAEKRLSELIHLQKEKKKIEKQSGRYNEEKIKLKLAQTDLKRLKKESDTITKNVRKMKAQLETMEKKKDILHKEITQLLASKRAQYNSERRNSRHHASNTEQYETHIRLLESEKIILQAELESLHKNFELLKQQQQQHYQQQKQLEQETQPEDEKEAEDDMDVSSDSSSEFE